jgi:fatty acid desaturase
MKTSIRPLWLASAGRGKKTALLVVCLMALILLWGSAPVFAAPPEQGPGPESPVATWVMPLPGGYWYVYGTSYRHFVRPSAFGYGESWYLHNCWGLYSCQYYYYYPYGAWYGPAPYRWGMWP